METSTKKSGQELIKAPYPGAMHRRSFLQVAGLGVASAALIVSGCKKIADAPVPNKRESLNTGGNVVTTSIDLGTGDVGVLNYLYLLEQLEHSFYTKVNASLYTGYTTLEQAYIGAICRHEVAHSQFYKNFLGPKAIPTLSFNFSNIDFSNRNSVLGTAKTFEDIGVTAYNGIAYTIKDPANLSVVIKIASVEARHAAVVRDLLKYNDFSDLTDYALLNNYRMEIPRTPSQVLPLIAPYLTTNVNSNNLPS